MRLKEIALSINPGSHIPLFMQIVEGMIDAIRTGRVAPGLRLPGTRALSESLNISRNTVITAFEELRARGWIEIREGSGARVADPLNGSRTPASADPRSSRKEYSISQDQSDARLLASEEIGKAFQHMIKRRPKELLELGEPRGHAELREALACLLAERRSMSVHPADILVTRGGTMSLNLIAQGLLKPGDKVAVEDPGNPAALESFKTAGAEVLGVPVDAEGLIPEALESILRNERIRMLYLTPRLQIPTTVTLSTQRRTRLLELAQRHRFAIVEDDPEADFVDDTLSSPPMAAGEGEGTVIYVNSLSHLLASSTRIGFVVAHRTVIDRLAKVRLRADWQGDQALECALAKFLKEGRILRHLQRVGRIYRRRREATIRQIRELFPTELSLLGPRGGFSLWIRTVPSVDLEAWRQNCGEAGVRFHTGRHYSIQGTPSPFLRLNAAAFRPEEMLTILNRMRAVLPCGAVESA